MAHRFQKSAADYACGQLVLMLQRLEDHQKDHAGQLPALFVLHPASSEALNAEHYKRYGLAHKMQFAGVPIVLCGCQHYDSATYPEDWLQAVDGSMELL